MPGGSSVVWWTTVTGWNSGTRRPGSSSAAARASVASSTARQRISPCSAVVTEVVETDVTRTPVCTVPGGSVRASSSGSTSAPPSGTHSRPRANARSARSAHRLDVDSSGSHSRAASSGRRKPSIVRAGTPRAARACPAGCSGRASRRSTGVPAIRESADPSRAWSTAVPSGAVPRGAVRAAPDAPTEPGAPRLLDAAPGRCTPRLRGAATRSASPQPLEAGVCRGAPRPFDAAGDLGALAKARTAWSAPRAPPVFTGVPARWWRPSLCSRTPGAKGRSTRPSSPGVDRSSGYAVDSSCPTRSSRKPSTFSVDIRPPAHGAASSTTVVTPAQVSRCAADSPATPAPTITTSAW